MARNKYSARAIYSDGRVIEGKHHKEVKRCFEDLKNMINKISAEGLVYLGIDRVIEVGNGKAES